MTEKYEDKTGTMEKPNPLRDVFLEFPRAMMELSRVTAAGALKHAPRGWRTFDCDYGLRYHQSKVGRHTLKEELGGPENHEDLGTDGKPLLHAAQAAWNQLAYLENLLKKRAAEKVPAGIPALVEAEREYRLEANKTAAKQLNSIVDVLMEEPGDGEDD